MRIESSKTAFSVVTMVKIITGNMVDVRADQTCAVCRYVTFSCINMIDKPVQLL